MSLTLNHSALNPKIHYMQIPFINLKPTTSLIKEKVLKDWALVLDNCEFVGGPTVTQVESKLKKALNVPELVTCANGTDALILGLQALGVKRGDKVALPNMTFWATYEAVEILGAIPVLVDIDPEHLQLCEKEFTKAYDQHKFKFAILVHLMGWCHPALDRMRAFCRQNSIALLEDGAQSYGVEFKGESVFKSATMGTLSFYPAKVLGTCMDGGAVSMQSQEHAALVRSLGNHGRAQHYSYAHIGWNSRMGGASAHFMNHMIDQMDHILKDRLNTVKLYREKTKGIKGLKMYGGFGEIKENGYLAVFTLQGHKGDEVVVKMKELGVGCGRVYPEPMHLQKPASQAIKVGPLTHSIQFCEGVFNLPLYYGIKESEVDYVVEQLKKVAGN
jgi:dTDP-4-amino-4,6-dideoxygalactose transaminase